MRNRHQIAANHSAAPITGRFVEDFRSVFGESLKVTHVKEGAIEFGKPDTRIGVISAVQPRRK